MDGSVPDMKMVWKFVEEQPTQMFMFKDEKAGMTFDPTLGCVMYVVGNFNPRLGPKYNTRILNQAISAALN